ncbi:MAG: glycosyltransferase family 4 protein [Clostridiales bacterium]|nr:glycosyltransferase family 4 protein [Clostridiales bacterium]
MKKILHITAHLGAGAGKAISGLIKNLEGYENTVILLEKPEDDKYCEICRQSGARVIIAPQYKEIEKEAEDTDIVIFNWWAHPLTVNLLTRLGKIQSRLIIWSHINGLHYPKLTFDFLDIFDGIMFTSPCSLKSNSFSENQRKAIEKKTSFVYGTGEFYPVKSKFKESYKADKNDLKIGYLGTLDFSKLNRAFPEICQAIKEKLPEAHFILCGKADENFKNQFFKDYADLKDCVDFKGFVTNAEEMLNSFDVFCYPLSSLNFATTENALLEAMAVALPIVVLDNPAESEIIDNAKSGIVAKGKEDFIEKTVLLLNDEKERIRLGTAARKTVINKYSTQNNVATFVEAVEKALKTQKTSHNFEALIGSDIWENFLYFCADEKENVIKALNGEHCSLSDIFYSNSKSSPFHYQRYFKDEHIDMLVNKLKEAHYEN